MKINVLCPHCKKDFLADNDPDYQIIDIMNHAHSCSAQKGKKKQ